MYATSRTTPTTVTIPAPTKDSPAAGTTGNPGAAVTGRPPRMVGFDVPHGVLVWAIGGLAGIVAVRAIFHKGGVA